MSISQDSTRNPKPVLKDSSQKITIWAKIAASLGVASLVSMSIGLVMGISTGSVLIVAGFAMAFYASIIGTWAERSGSSKSNKLAKKGILFGSISMIGIATYMFFGLLWAWYRLISFFS